MTIVIAAKDESSIRGTTIVEQPGHAFIWVATSADFKKFPGADGFVDFNEATEYESINKPLLINQTINTFSNIQGYPANAARFCCWPGFAERATWEIALAAPATATGGIGQLVNALGKNFEIVADEPGLVAPRILSMIINEACFAISEGTSEAAEIDIAMKLGTNYPEGPINWGRKIGGKRIHTLLQRLSEVNDRYHPHPLLTKYLA